MNYDNRLNVIDLELSNIQLKKAIQLDSSYAKAYSMLADNYFHIYYYEGGEIALQDSALLLCEKAISINPNLSDPYGIKGIILNSTSEVKKALQLNLNSAIGYYYLGWIQLLSAEFSEALINFLNALELDKHNPTYNNYVGIGYGILLFDEESEKYHKKNIEIQPDYIWAYENLLYLAYAQGRYEDELKYAKIMYNLNPNYDWSLHRMGEAYTHLGNYVEAEKYFRKCEKIIRDSTFHETSGSAPFRYRLAIVLWHMDQKEEALKLFNEQMERDKYLLHDDEIQRRELYDLAAVNAFLGNKEEAFYWLEKFKESKPWDVYDYRLMEQEELFDSIKEDERFKAIVKEVKEYVLKEREKFEQSGVKGIL
jgi:tetratricopeptide (TPR) repeat protein